MKHALLAITAALALGMPLAATAQRGEITSLPEKRKLLAAIRARYNNPSALLAHGMKATVHATKIDRHPMNPAAMEALARQLDSTLMAMKPTLILLGSEKPQLDLGRPDTDYGIYGHQASNALNGMVLGAVKMWVYFMDDACLPLNADSCRITRTRNGGYVLDFNGKRNAVRTTLDSNYLMIESGSPNGKDVVMRTEFMPTEQGLLLRRANITLPGDALDMSYEYRRLPGGYVPSVVAIHTKDPSNNDITYTFAIDDYRPTAP